jgi:GNAT superfamily N-acetyltransferase
MATDHAHAAQGARRSAGTVEWSRITPARERAVVRDATGRELSWLFMETSRVRIGSAAVKAGVVGGVETRADCRGQGHGRVVMEAALARFAQKSCTIGFLFGIPDY